VQAGRPLSIFGRNVDNNLSKLTASYPPRQFSEKLLVPINNAIKLPASSTDKNKKKTEKNDRGTLVSRINVENGIKLGFLLD
jgi:hypothetical protein